MASSTTNLDLILPVGGEHVSRQITNANNVKIDEAVGPVPSGTDLQSQVTALNNNIEESGTLACFAQSLGSNGSIKLKPLSSSFFILIQPNATTCSLINVGDNGSTSTMFGSLTGINIAASNRIVTITSTISWNQILVVLGATRVN